MTRPRLARVFGGLAAAAALACATPARAAMLAMDDASNYGSTNPWVDGSNGGSGFGTWNLSNNDNNGSTAFAGYFLGDSTAGSGDINTGGQSFGIYANPNGAFATAVRTFGGGALSVGQTFSIQLAVNFRNGGKGINLSDGGTQFFNFNVGNDDYTYQNGAGGGTGTSLGDAYSPTSVFTLTYLQQSATTGVISISRPSTTTFTETINASGFDSFTLYNSNTDNGSDANNLYFNNISVVPEPSTYVCMAMGLTGLIALRCRRR